jgi:large subunit ribosomal protein L29
VKPKEIREMTTAELEVKLRDAHQELFNLRVQRATRELQNYARFQTVRRDIARIQTLLRERVMST